MIEQAQAATQFLKDGGGYALCVVLLFGIYYYIRKADRLQAEFNAERTKIRSAFDAKLDVVREQVNELMRKQIELAVLANVAVKENTAELARVRSELRPTQEDLAKLLIILNARVQGVGKR